MRLDQNTARVTRSPSGFQFSIADRIEFLNPTHWDSVTAGASVFLSRRYLNAMQAEFAGEMVRDVGLVYESGEPVAAVSTQSFNVIGSQLVRSKSDVKASLVDGLKRKSMSLLNRRVMLCGNIHTWGPHGVAFAAGTDPARLWPGVAECLYRIRRANRLHGQTDYVIIKDLFPHEHEQAVALQAFGYRSLETEPNMVLAINKTWRSMDCYLGSLTKRYRAAAKKVLKPFVGGQLVVAPVADVQAETDRLHELYKSVASRAEICLFSLNKTTLPHLAESLGEDFVTLGIRQDDILVGFVSVVRDGDTAIGFYLGIDYEANAELPIYHRLLLAVVEQGIAWQCDRISFGRTALDAKSRLGCVPEETHVWARHRVPVLNVIVQQIMKNVHHAEPPDRNTFKQET